MKTPYYYLAVRIAFSLAIRGSSDWYKKKSAEYFIDT